jgi:hypothetical protein
MGAFRVSLSKATGAISVWTRRFAIDYALNAAIPWTARECLQSATGHIGGSLETQANFSGPTLLREGYDLLACGAVT